MSSVPPENEWAMIPKSVIDCLTCGDCLRLYCLLDEEQRVKGWPVRGVGLIAHRLGWQPRTAKTHLLHLAEVGIIRCDPIPLKGMAWGTIRFRLEHNPARGRFADLTPVPKVWTQEPLARWRRPSQVAEMVARRATSSAQHATDMRVALPVSPLERRMSGEPLHEDCQPRCPCGEVITDGGDSCNNCAPF
jgi:hypothetical protein